MINFINFVDRITEWFGKAFAWCILVMTFGTGYEVFVRYFLRDPTSWSFDLSYMMYGTMFMMAGAYALSRDAHVRGDFLYRLWQPKTQAKVEFILYFIFFFPGVIALIYAGFKYAQRSMPAADPARWEVSVFSPAGMPVFQFKMVIVAAGLLLFIQGLAQLCRCIVAMRTNEWPVHAADDVEELEDVLLKKGASAILSEEFVKNNPEVTGRGN
ncbi:MAG: TRAP transporter small permease subunit [Rhizobiales bacterium]|nr:TRAP transporter small permease subunit [Hyphomicrobiales bacterium]